MIYMQSVRHDSSTGELSREAEEVAAEERRVMTSIDKLLDELSKEKNALLVSLDAHQVRLHFPRPSCQLMPEMAEHDTSILSNLDFPWRKGQSKELLHGMHVSASSLKRCPRLPYS